MKATRLIVLASRILLMNQPPQKKHQILSDFMKHSRWEDLERSPLFIELNILESSPSLNRNETTHRQIQSRSGDAGLGGTGCLGLGTGSLSAPG